MLVGKKVILTAVERADIEILRTWRNNENLKKHFREYRYLTDRMQEQWFEKAVNNDATSIMFSIKRASDNLLLGCCGLVYAHWVYRHADLSLYIGHNDAYIDDKGYAKESCELLFTYAFKDLGLNKIWTEIYSFDDKKKKLYQRLGMSIDGVLRQNYFYEGKYWDSNVFSILASEWRPHGK